MRTPHANPRRTRAAIWRAAILTGCLLWLLPNAASAEAPACHEVVANWAQRCPKLALRGVQAVECPSGRVVIDVGGPGRKLRVELGRATSHSFKRVGEVGVSPVGEFVDWAREPEFRQTALSATLECVREHPELVLAPHSLLDPSVEAAVKRSGPAVPWRSLIGLALVAALFALAACRARRRRLELALCVGFGLLVLVVRRLWVAPALFHQNGQGPEWVADALWGAGLSRYGPGYAELYGWLVSGHPEQAEQRIFMASALCMALAAAALLFVSRILGASRLLGALLALIMLIDPLAARLAGSESYFAPAICLFALAASATALGTERGPRRRLRFSLGVVGAGLLVAQALRIHPLCWVPAAGIPLVVVLGRGSLRRRVRHTLLAGAGIGCVAALGALPAMLSVLKGELGERWKPAAQLSFVAALPWLLVGLVLGALFFVASRRRRADAIPGLTLLLCLALAAATNSLRHDFSRYELSYVWQFSPTLLLALSAGMMRLRSRQLERAVIALAALAGATFSVLGAPRLTAVATDAREAALMGEWMRGSPDAGVVAYLSRLDDRVVALPAYEPERQRVFPLRAGDAPPALLVGGYYYRSSLCAIDAGREACQRLERGLRLQPLKRWTLPAVASQPWHPLPMQSVEVAVFRCLPPSAEP